MLQISDLIYNHLIEQESKTNISLDKTEKITIDDDKLDKSIEDIQQRLKVKLTSGKCSAFLINQLAQHLSQSGEKFKDKVEFYNSSEILNTIELIENNVKTGSPFYRSECLKDYIHIHLSPYASNGSSVVRNVLEYWFKKKKIRTERISDYKAILNLYPENIGAIAITMHQKAMINKELKGEWLIYKLVNNTKYYLCLAAHGEDDKDIFDQKLKVCIEQFPELN